MSKKKENKKNRRPVSVAGIVIKIILFLAGVAILAVLVWIGVQVGLVLKFKA